MKALRWTLLIAVLLHLPMLFSGAYMDDFVHRAALAADDPMGQMGPMSLFDFGSSEDFQRAADEPGARLPWFAGENWRVRFLRPLASLELSLAEALFPDNEVPRHLVGLLLLLVLILAARRLFQDLGLNARALAIATAVVAFSDSAVIPVGWAANRSTLWVLLFSILAVNQAHRGRVMLALGLCVVATLFKESGLLAFPLVCARLYGIGGGDRHRMAARASLLGALLVVAYLGHYIWAGYGTNCLFYAAPWSTPVRYGLRLATLMGVGLPSLAGPVPVDLAGLFPVVGAAMAGIGALLTVLVVRVLLPDWREHRAVPFLVLWTLLGFLPEAGAPPSDRLLWMATVGAAGLLGLALDRRFARWQAAPRRARIFSMGLLLCALPFSAGNALLLGDLNRKIAAYTRALVSDVDLGQGPRDLFLIQTSNAITAFGIAPAFHVLRQDQEARFQHLQVGRRGLRWTRTGPNSCTFESLDEPFLFGPFEKVYQTDESAPVLGARWSSPPFEVEAIRVDEQGLRSVRFTLNRSLDSADMLFLIERGGVLETIPAPALGSTLDLPAGPPALPLVP